MKKISAILILAIFLPGLVGCGSDDSGAGSLSVYLTDASQQTYEAVYITVDDVEVHKGNAGSSETAEGWYTVASPHQTYNLLELVNGVMQKLGTRNLETGIYTQMRLILGNQPDDGLNVLGRHHEYANYLITDAGEIHELKIPSGYQTGIKLVHEFELTRGLTVELVLDFDVSQSIIQAGQSGQYLLKPTIKVMDTEENAIVAGTVTDDQGAPLSDAIVSAQTYDPQAADEAGRINIDASTRTDANGMYQMYVPPGTYYLTAFKGGDEAAYGPACEEITVDYNNSYTQNLQLNSSPVGQLEINIVNSSGDVAISIQKTAPCQSGDARIQVATLPVEGDGAYDISLPGGDPEPESYTIVAVNGDKVMSQNLELSANESVSVSVSF